MLSKAEKKEIARRLDEVRNGVRGLRNSLNEINDQKESWFGKKKNTTDEIFKLAKQLKEVKTKRDSLTKEVKSDKEERGKYNEQIQKNIENIKGLEKEKRETAKKHNIQGDPSKIKEEIDKLELRIETDVMGFDKERGLMKRIKDLKKRYGEAKSVSSVWEKIRELSKETDELRKRADELHNKVQVKAVASQKKHEEGVKLAKKMDELKEKEQGEYERFFEFKRKFMETNGNLKKKLVELNELNQKLVEDKKIIKEKIELEKKETLKSKEMEIEEKIKKGEKITTEDLLVFQAKD